MLDGCTRLTEKAVEQLLGPVPEGYLEGSSPEPAPDIPLRSPEALADLKRETIKTIKAVGLIQNGKPVDYQWAFYAIHTLSQKLGNPTGIDIAETTDEGQCIALHNAAVELLRKARRKLPQRTNP